MDNSKPIIFNVVDFYNVFCNSNIRCLDCCYNIKNKKGIHCEKNYIEDVIWDYIYDKLSEEELKSIRKCDNLWDLKNVVVNIGKERYKKIYQ